MCNVFQHKSTASFLVVANCHVAVPKRKVSHCLVVVLVLFLENDEEENAKEATTGRSSGST